MTRKKYIKSLMALGYSRDWANLLARYVRTMNSIITTHNRLVRYAGGTVDGYGRLESYTYARDYQRRLMLNQYQHADIIGIDELYERMCAGEQVFDKNEMEVVLYNGGKNSKSSKGN